MNLLSIDDSKAVHAFIDRCLTGSTHAVTHALSAKEGLEKLNSGSGKYDLILLDWEMPEINGPEALQLIRKTNIKIPVVMVTSKSDPQDIQTMLDHGVSDYIMKPFTPGILIEKIESVLSAFGADGN